MNTDFKVERLWPIWLVRSTTKPNTIVNWSFSKRRAQRKADALSAEFRTWLGDFGLDDGLKKVIKHFGGSI